MWLVRLEKAAPATCHEARQRDLLLKWFCSGNQCFNNISFTQIHEHLSLPACNCWKRPGWTDVGLPAVRIHYQTFQKLYRHFLDQKREPSQLSAAAGEEVAIGHNYTGHDVIWIEYVWVRFQKIGSDASHIKVYKSLSLRKDVWIRATKAHQKASKACFGRFECSKPCGCLTEAQAAQLWFSFWYSSWCSIPSMLRTLPLCALLPPIVTSACNPFRPQSPTFQSVVRYLSPPASPLIAASICSPFHPPLCYRSRTELTMLHASYAASVHPRLHQTGHSAQRMASSRVRRSMQVTACVSSTRSSYFLDWGFGSLMLGLANVWDWPEHLGHQRLLLLCLEVHRGEDVEQEAYRAASRRPAGWKNGLGIMVVAHLTRREVFRQ